MSFLDLMVLACNLRFNVIVVWKNNEKSIVDEFASHVTRFVQALSLELVGELAVAADTQRLK